jgi:Holliday junction resolvase RusA-like endonuclease
MIVLKINIRPIPKPCGALMKGKLVMNPIKVLADGTSYGQWKKNVAFLIEKQLGKAKLKTAISNIYGIAYQVICPLARKDLSNCIESVQDALVESGLIEDDRLSIVPRIHATHVKSKELLYNIYICENKSEWLHIMSILE